jgi:hypothetical protein
MANHLYRLGNAHQGLSGGGMDKLWVCAYSPYKLCRRCPLYYGVKATHSETIQKALSRTTQSYSLYGYMNDMCDVNEIPSLRCRNNGWHNMKPVEEVLPQTQEI